MSHKLNTYCVMFRFRVEDSYLINFKEGTCQLCVLILVLYLVFLNNKTIDYKRDFLASAQLERNKKIE